MEAKKSVITVPKETTVTFLKSPEVSFVSLVRHGANNTPFRVIKSNKGGQMNKIVQAIRVPKDSKVDIEALVGKDFRKDSVEEDGTFLVYEQVDKSVCNPDTKSIVLIDKDSNVYAVTYDLLAEETPKGDKKSVTDDKLPDTIVVAENIKEISYWDVWDEMYSMTEIISGSLGQSVRSEEDRKTMVLSAIDNFRAFCETVFSEMKSVGPLPMEKRLGGGTAKLFEIMQKQVSTNINNKGGGTMFELESKEELVGIISDVVVSAIEKKTAEDAKSVETTAKVEADAKAIEDKEKEITDLKESVKTLIESVEKLSGTVISKTVVDDIDPDGKTVVKSVYSGMFKALVQTPAGISGRA